jgi:hypothetical protein
MIDKYYLISLQSAGKPPYPILLQHHPYLAFHIRTVTFDFLEKHCPGDLQRVLLTSPSDVTRCEKYSKGRRNCNRFILKQAVSTLSPCKVNVCSLPTGAYGPRLRHHLHNSIFVLVNIRPASHFPQNEVTSFLPFVLLLSHRFSYCFSFSCRSVSRRLKFYFSFSRHLICYRHRLFFIISALHLSQRVCFSLYQYLICHRNCFSLSRQFICHKVFVFHSPGT